MTNQVLHWVAAGLCVLLAVSAVARSRGVASWLFFGGMLLLAVERMCESRVINAADAADLARWLGHSLLVKSLIPAVWLGFSLVYARGNRGEFLKRWRWILISGLIVPPLLIAGVPVPAWELDFAREGNEIRFLPAGQIWVVMLLLLTLGILINLEKTFRVSVGMSRWRIKYLFLGAGMIFGVKLYALSQALLFSGFQPTLVNVTAVGVVIGCLLIAVGQSRSSFGSFDLYPSRAILQGSLTVLLAGVYFLVVGLLAQVVAMLGGVGSLPAQAFLLLLGLVGLTVLLLSDRFRNWLQRFVSRHFRRPEHDFRKLWTDFTRATSNAVVPEELGKNAVEVISESFHVLGVSVLRLSAEGEEMEWLHSTDETAADPAPLNWETEWTADLLGRDAPVNLESERSGWAGEIREACGRRFDHGGDRLVVPLTVTDRLVGVLVLADRVNGVPYSHEELDLLNCIGDQLAAGLLNCTLTEKVLQAKELEAFQTLSTFFVHDLKNAANSLNLMLQNLPVHFDDPEFREDAIRAVGRTVDRINKMILNLSSLRREIQLRVAPCQPADLIGEVLDELEPQLKAGHRLERRIEPLPAISLDREAIRSVLTNLVTNASEAIEGEGRIGVSAAADDGGIRITVEDDGSGMSEAYVRTQLFRPFHSTKTKGLGIGMFQCKKILEAHGGCIRVDSEPGRGTRFTLRLPGTPPTEP